MRVFRRIAIPVVIATAVLSWTAPGQAPKPMLKVGADGWPSGHDTAEGAACDLVRALINRDEKLFCSACIRLYVGGKGPDRYAQFLTETVQNIRKEAARKNPSPRGPRKIAKVFAARHLTLSGPSSFGYAAFDFRDLMFVDADLDLYNGEKSSMRLLVIRDRDGKWYVHPAPNVTPLLCQGLDQEKPSTVELSDAYDLQK
jgi:hypothetical protein